MLALKLSTTRTLILCLAFMGAAIVVSLYFSITRHMLIANISLAIALLAFLILLYQARFFFQEQKLSENKFRSLLDAAPDGTVIVDEHGYIKLVNRQIENIFGYNRDELIDQPVEILIPRDVREKHIHHRADFFKAAGVRPMGVGLELHAVKKDGTSFPVEISLSPIQTQEGMLVSAAVRDITGRKKAEQKFRTLLDAAPDATVIVDENGLIQMVNRQTENLFGYSREELIGQPVEILMPENLHGDHVKHRRNFMNAPKIRSMGVGLELNAVKKDGTLFPVEISLSPIETEQGMLISAAIRDITRRRTLETDLKRTNAEVEAFTYSVSHDLRAPLRGVIGFATILEEDYASQLDDEAKRIASVIRGNAAKMGRLIDDLLAFSRMGRQDIVKTRINTMQMVREIVEEVASDDNANVQWDIEELPPIIGDLGTIRQVWVNLISNAVKYSGKKEKPCISIGSFRHEGQLAFFVRDNGVGFDENYSSKLFKVFQRLHSVDEFEGTGVGLALVEKIISRHKGKVWAKAQPGIGATFYFSLPDKDF